MRQTCWPVRELREHLLAWKLLRKLKGRLVLTPRGRRCRERPADLWDYMLDAVGRPEHEAVRLVTRLYAEWHLSGIAPPWNRQTEAIRGAMESRGLCDPVWPPHPRRLGHRHQPDVIWKLGCLHLMEPKKGYFDQGC